MRNAAYENDLQRLEQARATGRLSEQDDLIESARIVCKYGFWERNMTAEAWVERAPWLWLDDEEGRQEVIAKIQAVIDRGQTVLTRD